MRSASPSLCWRSTTARSRYSRIESVSHHGATISGPAPHRWPNRSVTAPLPIVSANMTLARSSRYLTVADQLYQLASGAVTSDELVRRSLHAIDASQSDAERLPGGAHRLGAGRRGRGRPAPRRRRHARCWASRSRSRTTSTSPVCQRLSAPRAVCRTATPTPRWCARLRAAGAVIVGKTNTCEFGQWPFTSGPGFGHTRNPWSRKHTPGGSSGGSAAAVAAGLVAAAIGSDGAGSVRIPAAWTNLVGIKPQRGRISTWPLPEAFNGITVNGVLARTVAERRWCSTPRRQRRRRPAQAAAGVAVRNPSASPRARCASRCQPGSRSPDSAPSLHPRDPGRARKPSPSNLQELGHTVVAGNPDYGLRLSWNFLSRSTSGLLDWADRLGDGVTLDARTLANMRMGRLLSQQVLRKAREHEAAVAAPGGFDLRRRRRRAGADHRAAAAERQPPSTSSAAPPPTAP